MPRPVQDPDEMMDAIRIARAGGPEVLELVRRPRPRPGPGEVLIEVRAAGVNGHDLHHRARGEHPLMPGETDLPGLEVAGLVAATGAGVVGLSIGDSICALVRGGGYAQFCTAPAAHCLPVPEGLSLREAASLPETFFTVWSNVFVDGGLAPGESLLVHGGTSGIGVTAIQLASALGHPVFATTSSAEKAVRCVALGARRAIDYNRESFSEIVLAETSGIGVNFVLDIACGDLVPQNLAVLAPGGRLCVIAAARGFEAPVDFRQVIRKNLTITGSTLRPRSAPYKTMVASMLREQIWPLFASGRLQPVVDSVYPIERVADAHAAMETGRHVGKFVLEIPPSNRGVS